jgi:hypothetical protein
MNQEGYKIHLISKNMIMKKLKLALFFLFLLFISCAKDNVDNSDDKYKYPDVAVKVKGDYTIDKVFDFINSFDIEVASINSPVYTSDLPSDSLQYVLDYLDAKAYTHNGNGMLVSGYLDYKTKVITIFPTLFNMKNTTYQADWLESMKILKLKEDTVSADAGYMIDFHVPKGDEEKWVKKLSEYKCVGWTGLVYLCGFQHD